MLRLLILIILSKNQIRFYNIVRNHMTNKVNELYKTVIYFF